MRINVRGPATIDVNRFQVIANMGGQAQAQGIYQINALNISNTLTMAGGNAYRLRVAGTIAWHLPTSPQSMMGGRHDPVGWADHRFGPAQQVTGTILRCILINNTTNNYTGVAPTSLGVLFRCR